MYHSGFVCVNIHLDRHDVRKIKLLEGTPMEGGAWLLYPKPFCYYVEQDRNDWDMQF